MTKERCVTGTEQVAKYTNYDALKKSKTTTLKGKFKNKKTNVY